MNGIIGMTELTLETDLTSEQEQYLLAVKSSADSLLRLLNDILDFSKIEAGKLDLVPMEFSLRERLSKTLKTMAVRAHKKGLELACRVRPDVPDILVGDPGRLCQIIVNLVGNAIKFTEQGEVVVWVKTESRSKEEVRLRFDVVDTGIGIPADKQGMIFDAFSQADSSMTRRFEGTGLGLTISAKLVELMGGGIEVHSREGEGSTFQFTACFGTQQEGAEGQQAGGAIQGIWPETAAPLAGKKILVVDDNASSRKILEEMLSGWNMAPVLTENGRSAIEILRRAAGAGQLFPLVLIDATMPDLDGFELTAILRQEPLLATASIVMLSPAGSIGDVERLNVLEVKAWVTKPVDPSELLEAILVALNSAPRLLDNAAAAMPAPHVFLARRIRILLAEDIEINQQLVIRILEKRGHHVTVAQNGKEVLDALERQSFDLILMDVRMPEMDGFEATAAIRKKESLAGGRIPIIAMTAHAMRGDRERCLEAGMDGYLSKPIEIQQLIGVVEGRSRASGPAQGAEIAAAESAGAVMIDTAALLRRCRRGQETVERADPAVSILLTGPAGPAQGPHPEP
jgi:CheY-like chemotaxis protein